MRRVTLPRAVRVFKRITPDGSRLSQTGTHLAKGDEVEIEAVETTAYDHDDQTALRFSHEGETYFLLFKETGLSRDILH